MKCAKCGTENKKASKFCSQCGAGLSAGGAPAPGAKAAAVAKFDAARPDTAVPFWKPDWRWHLKTLGLVYAALVVVYFVLSNFLAKVPEPHRMRDIPKEMTPWLKK